MPSVQRSGSACGKWNNPNCLVGSCEDNEVTSLAHRLGNYEELTGILRPASRLGAQSGHNEAIHTLGEPSVWKPLPSPMLSQTPEGPSTLETCQMQIGFGVS